MLQVTNIIKPEQSILDALAGYQKEIDDLHHSRFEVKRSKAKESFSQKNKKGNSVFDAIKIKLLEISPGIERCVYCEDSKCDEVEHIYPKDLYPQYCFVWSNYVYACGTCNAPKNNKFKSSFRRCFCRLLRIGAGNLYWLNSCSSFRSNSISQIQS